jgi:hypothetical protein
LNFPSDVIAALRGNTKILTGNGTMSGDEVVKTQPPATLSCIYQPSALAATAVTVTFVGDLSPNGPVIDFQSATVLIPSTVHFTLGEGHDESEDRLSIRLHVKRMSATTLKGEWPYGTFVLTKK